MMMAVPPTLVHQTQKPVRRDRSCLRYAKCEKETERGGMEEEKGSSRNTENGEHKKNIGTCLEEETTLRRQ